ncbi:NifU family protein [Lyticum sinuosum]|uniref:Fe/S biogenesis protein NifU-like protein n=1 Tax=Lyticum sinuosum TaxID=1332059 RepID=A0AAE4VL91_9RICK|nr:NifU family protein [Lyticum sinuosum]MDZ5761489.1 Fe/S biogenesis protein NifU-like protein [Lyticum sinuosum]
MFIQIVETPNPNTLKFIPGINLLEEKNKTYHFDTVDSCSISPLALSIMSIPSVNKIMIANDFISVTKKEEADWITTKTLIVTTIIDHISQNYPIFLEEHDIINHSLKNNSFLEKNTEKDNINEGIISHIKALIEEKVRPAVAMDGGDIEFVSFDSGIVYLKMHGACSGCPSSSYTLKNGIENMLRYYIPEIHSVEKVEDY